MEQNKEIWIGAVAVLVIAALFSWWVVDQQPLFTSINIFSHATSTPATSTAVTAHSGTTATAVTKVDRSTQSVSTIVAGLKGATLFNTLYRSTGVNTLVGTSTYTIFVPTDTAFNTLPDGTLQNMTSAQKKRLIEYHIVSGRAIDVSAVSAGTVQALSGDALNFNYGIGKVPLVNSAVVITEYTGKNGVVYLIDNVLLPPKKVPAL